MPKISVIIPCYNVEQYLRQCLDSVVNQTLKDIEIICVNDGSTDGSLEILNEYASKDNRINVISQANEGLASARNTGLENISGEYVYFLDSDDYIEPTLLENAMNFFENYDIDYFCFGSDAFGEGECIQSLKGMNNYVRVKRNGLFDLDFGIGVNTNIHVWNKIFKKCIIERYNIKFINGLLYEDIYFMWYYFFVSRSAYFEEKVYHHYRMRSDAIMEVATRNKTFESGMAHLYNWHELMLSMDKNKMFDKYFDEILYLLNFYTKRTIEMVPKRDRNRVLKMSKHYQKEMFRFNPDKKVAQIRDNIFSIKNSIDRNHKVICLCGMKLKVKRR